MGRKLKPDKEKYKTEAVKVDSQVYSIIKNQVEKNQHIPNYSMNMALRDLIGQSKIDRLFKEIHVEVKS